MISLGVVFSRLLQVVKLERDAFVWMDFNDRATGDAAILVAITQILVTLGLGTTLWQILHPAVLVSILIGGLFFWVFFSGAVFAISRFIFDTSAPYAIYLRITGFAAPTLLLMVFFGLFLDNPFLAMIAGGAWFIWVVANGLTFTVDLALDRAATAAAGGFALLVVVQAILGSIWIF